MENEGTTSISIDQLVAMIADAFADMREQFVALETHIGAVEATLNKHFDSLNFKIEHLNSMLEEHHRQTKTDHAVVGSMSHTLGDHEERIKMLEGDEFA
jgi:hypothetical protein